MILQRTYLVIMSLSLLVTAAQAEKITHEIEQLSPNNAIIRITVILDPQEGLLHDTLRFATNNPALTLQTVENSQPSEPLFDKSLNETKQVYMDTVIFTVPVQHNTAIPLTGPRDVIMHYFVTNTKEPRQYIISDVFHLQENPPSHTSELSTSKLALQKPLNNRATFGDKLYDVIHAAWDTVSQSIKKISTTIPVLLQRTESLPLQMILVLLLGILMSLTPCIYPMIPITVGVLGANPGNSFWRNFSLAFSYTSGLATTFAVLGLLASFFGAQSGTLLANPWFVGALVFILGYLGLSMFGFYEMYIPKFLQPKTSANTQGSLISAFLFGAATGTIASPCMSPGLALVLTLVAHLGNVFLGFLLLFIFGFGSGLPLLLVGTFSSSLQLLPRAGMWMLEVKKVFGFLLILMCFYYLQNVMPLWIVAAAAALFFALCGFYYLSSASTAQSGFGKFVMSLVGVILLVAGIYTAYSAYKYFVEHTAPTVTTSVWQTDYAAAHAQAVAEQKLLLLDFTASWCPSCKALAKRLHQPAFENAQLNVISVVVDGSDTTAEPYAGLKQKYDIIGLPTVLLIDPTTDTLVNRWGAELLDNPIEQFVAQLQN